MTELSEQKMKLRTEFSHETGLIFINNIPAYADWLEKKLALRQPPVVDSWVAVSERLPEIPKDVPSYDQRVKVIASWGNKIENMAEMYFCRRIVRGKEVYRFEWMGKISPWKVDYWREFPNPPKEK